ncbi:MAG: serine/threonine-protein kinase [Polyangiaceae bacterium]
MNAPAQPNDDVPVRPGQILAGKYRVDRVLGRGGMGVVVEARHVALDERVALKFLLPDYAQMPEASARFLREARAAVKIKSEHVARVSDVGTLETGSPYMVMEFLEGIDLSKALESYGVCQIPDAIDYLIQTCEAIAEAHGHGIVHRDLKPANLFLTRRPDGTPMIKVLDFGISKMSGSGVDNLTRTTTSMGSALYMSPEQMQTTRGVDLRTDIYALGISLYELLAGKQPFYADTLPQLCAEVLTGRPTPIRQLRAEVPDALAAVLERAYARDRDQRYQTIAELVAALAPWAPPRSQTTLDRIARMAGVTPAVAGAAPRHPTNSGLSSSQPNLGISGANPIAQAGQSGSYPAQAGQSGGYPAQPAAHAQTGGYAAQTANYQTSSQTGNYAAGQALGQTGNPQVGAQTGNSQLGHAGMQTGNHLHHEPLDIAGYQGPMSTKAAAAFAAGATTGGLSRTGNLNGSSGKTGLFVVIAVLAVLLLGLGMAFLFLRGRPDATAQSGATTAAETAPPAPTPAPTTMVTAAPTTTATAEPTATPTTTATAEPTATSTAKPKTPGTKPTGTGTGKKPGQMTSR